MYTLNDDASLTKSTMHQGSRATFLRTDAPRSRARRGSIDFTPGRADGKAPVGVSSSLPTVPPQRQRRNSLGGLPQLPVFGKPPGSAQEHKNAKDEAETGYPGVELFHTYPFATSLWFALSMLTDPLSWPTSNSSKFTNDQVPFHSYL